MDLYDIFILIIVLISFGYIILRERIKIGGSIVLFLLFTAVFYIISVKFFGQNGKIAVAVFLLVVLIVQQIYIKRRGNEKKT